MGTSISLAIIATSVGLILTAANSFSLAKKEREHVGGGGRLV